MNKSMPGKTFTGNIPFVLLMVALLAGSLYSAPAA